MASASTGRITKNYTSGCPCENINGQPGLGNPGRRTTGWDTLEHLVLKPIPTTLRSFLGWLWQIEYICEEESDFCPYGTPLLLFHFKMIIVMCPHGSVRTRFLVSGFMWIVILGTSQSTAGGFRRRKKIPKI